MLLQRLLSRSGFDWPRKEFDMTPWRLRNDGARTAQLLRRIFDKKPVVKRGLKSACIGIEHRASINQKDLIVRPSDIRRTI
jgi:hypothetical protein